MRNIIGILVVALLVSTSINAQEKKGRVSKTANFTSKQIATLQTKRMVLNLDLDKDQQKEVYALKKKQADERQKNVKGFRQNKQNGVRPTSDERFELRNTRLEKQLENKAAMKKILTNEQFEKWNDFDKKNGSQQNRIAKGQKMKKNCTEKGSKNIGKPKRQLQNRS